MSAIRLNIGAGDAPLDGYIPVDRKFGHEACPLPANVIDANGQRVYITDGSVDEIRASHVLEHFGHRETAKVLAEWYRVLKPGGVLKVAVPNFEWIAKGYLSGARAPFQGYTMGGHTDADDRHGAIFDDDVLFELLEKSGFTDVEPWRSEIQDCASLPVSLNLMGRKAVDRKIAVECAMSVPRLGFMSNFFCWAENLLLPFGIRPVSYDGAFWGQCLERVMESFAERKDPPDYILTVDYDSFFTTDTVKRLLVTAMNHPEADALAPVQVKRGNENVPLMGLRDENGVGVDEVPSEMFTPWLAKVTTAHFGLTLIKTEALLRMPHPWFHGQPDRDGRWGDHRTDDDIHFWNKWAECGNSLYLANRCAIGHGEYVVLWPDRQFGTIHQATADFRKAGMPQEVWR